MMLLKNLAAASALAAATIGFAGTANAGTFLCTPAPGTCSFDGTTGGFSNVKRTANQTASDTFKFLFSSAGTATLTFTTAKLKFGTATFDGLSFTPVSGQQYLFNIAAAGTYALVMSVSNPGKIVSSYSATADFEAVPEPAMWGMMIGGFGLAGAAMRRRAPVLARA
jgi:hypothetical protein